MRSTFLLLLTIASAVVADEPKPFSFFARSPHYSLAVDLEQQPDGTVVYNATVIDLATNTVVFQPKMTAPAATPAIKDTIVSGVRFHLRIGPLKNDVFAELDVTQGQMLIDLIRTAWIVAPRQMTAGGPVTGTLPEPPIPAGYFRVGGDVKAPVVIKRVEPMYNDQARKDRIAGIVILQAMIDETGKVKDAVILRDLPDGLGQAAVDAVKQWEFSPALRDGKPVPVVFNLTTNFKLEGVAPQ